MTVRVGDAGFGGDAIAHAGTRGAFSPIGGGGRMARVAPAGLALLGLLLAGCEEKNTYVAPPPPKVTVAPVLDQPVTRFLELTGNTASINSVDLNARVQGFLTAIKYTDGQLARKGTTLFVIEQDQYKAQLDQAKAQLAANQALQVQAEAEFNRQAQLAKQDFASQATLDQARAKRDQAVANTQNAQASLQLAQINLGYTEVTAPFDGAVTAHLQDVGALVGYSGPTKLASIVQLNPIWVWFTLSEQQVLRIKEHLAKQGRSLMTLTRDLPDIPVEIGLQTETGYPHQGKIDYIAPQVDPNLGTLTVRGIFKNDDFALLPGLFTRIRLPLGDASTTVLVPDSAISYNQLGPYVLTVNDQSVVAQTQVTLGQLQANGLRAIEGGLKSGDRIIINGIQRAVPGSKVEVETAVMTGTAPSATDDGSKALKPQGATPSGASPSGPTTPSGAPAAPPAGKN